MNNQETSKVVNDSLLPRELQRAQEAINLPEVQQMLKELAKYNLGICMPHMHDEGTGQFQILPSNMVQVESDLQVQFVARSEAEKIKSIPVAWQWIDDGVIAMAGCVQQCVVVNNPSGGEAHKKMHSTY